MCVYVGGGGGGANLEQEAFQYFSGAELNKKLQSLPPHMAPYLHGHAKEELQFGVILFHINLQSLHNLHFVNRYQLYKKNVYFIRQYI